MATPPFPVRQPYPVRTGTAAVISSVAVLYDHLGDKWLAVGRDEGDDAELLWRLLAAAPRQDGRSAFTAAQFDAASLEGASGFGGATSRGAAMVDRPVLTGALRLWETVWAQ